MILKSDIIKAKIIEHAKEEFPRECCGLIVNVRGKKRYIPCKNIAVDQSDFIMDPFDFASAEDLGEVMAIVHSHPNGHAKPSQSDLVACENSGIPWVIISVGTELFETIEPKGYKAPLIGREYRYGVLDCYTIVRDWYREKMKVELPDFERPQNWWDSGGDLFAENFKGAGFIKVPIEEITCGDLILMQIRSSVVNHIAIYLGDDIMLHHGANRLSTREVFGGWWKKNTRFIIRYNGGDE